MPDMSNNIFVPKFLQFKTNKTNRGKLTSLTLPNYLLCTCVVLLRTTCRPKLTCVRAAASASPSYNLVHNYILPFFRYRSCVKMSSTNVCMHEKRASVISRLLAGLFPLLTHQMLRHREREEIVYECVLHMLYIVVVFCSPAGLCVTERYLFSLSHFIALTARKQTAFVG